MSEYVKIIDRTIDTLVVVFSHINTPAGQFSHFQTLTRLPYSFLFVNCPNNSYYLGGIPGVGKEVRDVCSLLQQMISGFNAKRTVFFGNSMGAFGALLFGLMLDADVIIALAPEVVPGLKGTSGPSVVGDRALFDSYYARNVLDLPQANKTRVKAFFGEKALGDMLAGLAMGERFPRSCVSLKNCFHSVAPFIHSVHGLDLFLKDMIEGGRSPRLLDSHGGDLFRFPALITGLYRGVVNGDSTQLTGLLAALPAGSSNETRSYAHTAFAKHLIGSGRVDDAAHHLRRAFAINRFDIETLALCLGHRRDEFVGLLTEDYLRHVLEPHRHDLRPAFYEICAIVSCCPEESLRSFAAGIADYFTAAKHQAHFRYHLGDIHLRRGDLESGEHALRQAIALHSPIALFHHRLSMVLERQGRFGEAAEAADLAVSLDPGNAHLQRRSQAFRVQRENGVAVISNKPAAVPSVQATP
ncbi:MAG: tetratricopeptide repeat protein [Rhodospirillales bacterium]